MRKNKYLQGLFVAAACCMLLTAAGCESEEEQRNNIKNLVDTLSNSPDMVSSYRSSFDSYKKQEYLSEASGNSIKSNLSAGNSDKVYNLLHALESYSYKEESIKTLLNEELGNCTAEILSGTSAEGIIKCISMTEPLSSLNYYADEHVIPFDKILEFARNNGTVFYTEDGKGGYYDNKKDQYKDQVSPWWDPLGQKYLRSGEIGTYKTYTLYEFYGDMLRVKTGKTWWTNESTPNSADERYVEYEIKGQYTIKDDDVIFVLKKGESYSFGTGTDMVIIGADSDEFVIIDSIGVQEYEK